MERGTDAERAAVAERWAAMERQRARTTRLLRGLILAMAGTVLLVVAVVPEACLGDAGIPPRCTAVTPAPTGLVIAVLGAMAIGYGLCQVTGLGRT